MIFYGFNAAFVLKQLPVSDTGGSIVIHVFGAYFGCAASYYFQPERAAKSKNIRQSYLSK